MSLLHLRFSLLSSSDSVLHLEMLRARSMLGYMRIANARPNDCHKALATLEKMNQLHFTVTQNVDGLHQEAGSMNVIELHGTLHMVKCLHCGNQELRSDFQTRLEALNPGWMSVLAEHAQVGGFCIL